MNKKFYFTLTIILFITKSVLAQNVLDKINSATNNQLNNMQIGTITMPKTIDGKKVTYSYQHVIGSGFIGSKYDENTNVLTVYRLPNKAKEDGRFRITVEDDPETYYLPVIIAKKEQLQLTEEENEIATAWTELRLRRDALIRNGDTKGAAKIQKLLDKTTKNSAVKKILKLYKNN